LWTWGYDEYKCWKFGHKLGHLFAAAAAAPAFAPLEQHWHSKEQLLFSIDLSWQKKIIFFKKRKNF